MEYYAVIEFNEIKYKWFQNNLGVIIKWQLYGEPDPDSADQTTRSNKLKESWSGGEKLRLNSHIWYCVQLTRFAAIFSIWRREEQTAQI